MNIASYLLGRDGRVWELSRLWAPNNHEPNLLTLAIGRCVRVLNSIERPEILVSYADPNVGHEGFVYRAASWIYDGRCAESRAYQRDDGTTAARRTFHSGNVGMTKEEIERSGWREVRVEGKHRYVKPMCKAAARDYAVHRANRVD